MTRDGLGEGSAPSADSATSATGTLHRDGVTLAGYAGLATWAWFLYGFGAVLPLLRVEQDTSRTVLGLHSLALATGAGVSGLLNVAVVRRLHRRGACVLGAALVAVGVVSFVLAPSPALTVTAVLVTGTGGAMVLNSAVPALSDHHGSGSAAALSEGNAVAAGVGLVAPLAVGGAVGLGWTWRPAVLVVLPLLAAFLLTVRRIPAGTAAVDAGPPPRSERAGRLPLVFWVYLVMLTSCVAIEFCCTAWSADLLRQRTSLSAAAASAGVTAVVGGMAAGRVAAGRLARRYPSGRLLAGALALTLAGWAVVWLTTHPGVALVGLAIVGLGIAGHYPLGVSMLLRSVPGRTDAAIGRTSIGVAVASGTAPFALGAVADATSTHTAFVAVPVFLVLASAALVTSSRISAARGG